MFDIVFVRLESRLVFLNAVDHVPYASLSIKFYSWCLVKSSRLSAFLLYFSIYYYYLGNRLPENIAHIKAIPNLSQIL